MTTTNTITEGRPPGRGCAVPPLLLGCGEPLYGCAALRRSLPGGRERPALEIQLPARLLEQRLTRQQR